MADSFSFTSSLVPRAIPWLGRLATVAAIVVLAWVGARIFWTLAAPAISDPALVVDTDPSRVARAIAARHLFGDAPEAGNVAAGPERAGNARLHGVFAPVSCRRGAMAILSVDGRPATAVREGEEILPGVVLHRVRARSVEISRGGRMQVLALPERGRG